MDENSITPPLSPYDQYGLDLDQDSDMLFADDLPRQIQPTPALTSGIDMPSPAYLNQRPFTCRTIKSPPKHLDSFIEILQSKYRPELDVMTELFGYQFVTCEVEQHLDKLFLFLSQWISRIQNKNPSPAAEVLGWRQDIIHFYVFLKSYILRYKNDSDTELPTFLTPLMSLLHSALLYVDTPTQVHYDSMCRVESTEYNCFHLCLDVYWESLEVLFLIAHKFKDFPYTRQLVWCSYGGDEEQKSLFSKMLQLLFWELVTLGQHVYSKVSIKEARSVNPFPCACVKELWTLCESLMRHRNTMGSDKPFWVYLHCVLQVIQEEGAAGNSDMERDSDVYMYPVLAPELKDKTGFSLWLLTHLSSLQADKSGTQLMKGPVDSNYHDVMTVLRIALTKSDISEVDMRFYLQCCIKLGENWEAHIALLFLFWDHFCKRLNSTFQLNTAVMDGLATISKSSHSLLEQCQRLGSGQYQFKPQDTSFQLFLGLLGNHLHKVMNAGSTQEWRQMKGRVYCKFHQRRMQELSENGLYNFTCLFLCLSLAADTEDVTGKMCDFYDMVDVSRISPGKIRLIWMGMYAILQIYQKKDIDATFLTDKLGQAFSNTCMDFSSEDLDPSRRHQLWSLSLFYLESLQELFESSSKIYPEHCKLMTDGFSSLMNCCRSNEFGPVLGTIDAVITRCRETRKTMGPLRGVEELYGVLWRSILPSLKTLSSSLTASPLIADTLAGLCLLAYDSFKKEDFINIVRFVQGGSINKVLCCRFWSHLLPVDGVLTLLSQSIPNYQAELIQTWVSCAIFLPASSSHLITMNRCMLSLSDVEEIMSQASVTLTEDTEKTCLHFVKAVDIVYTKTTIWKERMQLRDKTMMYFSNIMRQVSPILQTLKPVETLSNVYAVIGFIVKCCSNLLFVQARPDCPLPDIIDSMIVPHYLFNPDKPVSPVFLTVTRDHLHLFVRGLGRLDYKKAPYVQRRLKDIIAIYLPKFWTSNSSLLVGTASTIHPLVVSLKESYTRQPTEGALGFRQFVLEVVLEKFLQSSQFTLPPNHHLALMFLKEILNRTVSKDVVSRDTVTVLDSVLTVIVLSGNSSAQQHAQQIAHQLLEASKVSTVVTVRDRVCTVLEKFVTDNRKVHLDRCIQALDKVSKVGSVFIHKILPKLQHFIVDHESYRGDGTNSKLRQNYTNLMKNIGGSSATQTKPEEDGQS